MPQLTIDGVGTVQVPAGKRLILALEEDARLDPLHACGGFGKCTTCRVEFLAGEPARMTVAEQKILLSRDLKNCRLACQIACDSDMTLRVIQQLATSGVPSPGPRPALEIQPAPVEWVKEVPATAPDDDGSLKTIQLQDYVQRWQAGDKQAADKLFRSIGARLEQLARRMLRGYPTVRNWADTADVLQGAVWRLLNALQKLNPPTTRDLFNLAAAHIRRELLDLARRSRKKLPPGGLDDSDSSNQPEAQESLGPAELELWTRFHEAVDQLEPEEREVFSLVFYHGWTQVQIAELFNVNEKTIRRRWQASCLTLSRKLGGQLPEL